MTLPAGKYEHYRSLDSWRENISDSFCLMNYEPLGDQGAFQASIQRSDLNSIFVSQIESSPIRVRRQKQHISHLETDLFLVKFQAEGESLITHRGQEARLSPGDFVLCSNTEPYELFMPGPYRHIVLAIPQKILNDAIRNPTEFLGKKMPAGAGSNGLLSQFVTSLAQQIDSMDHALIQRLEANVLDLLVTSLNFSRPNQSATTDGLKTEHLYRIKNFIKLHLDDPGLSPDWIARAHNISTRYLHMLFKQEPLSISRYIQQQRLEACKKSLKNSALMNFNTTEIGYRWGFNDPSHFNRSFKKMTGLTPRQYRLTSLKDKTTP